MSTSKKCMWCGVYFKVKPYLRNKSKYCSYKCYWKSLEGKTPWNKGKTGIYSTETLKLMGKGNKIGEKSKAWRGGIVIRQSGRKGPSYIHVYCPEHPRNNRKYVLQSRLIVEQHLKRYLEPTEIVHHIDSNTMNNNPNNLFVFENRIEHRLFHFYLNRNPILKNWLKSNII